MWVLASDIDNTLTGGDPEALKRLSQKIAVLGKKGKLFLILCTGRLLNMVLDGHATEYIPQADAVICQVGTEIYLPPFENGQVPMKKWDQLLKKEYTRKKAEEFVKDIDGLLMQPDEFNTPLKTSCWLDQCPDPEQAAKMICERVAPFSQSYRVIWSSGKDLDVLPAQAGKGNAIKYLTDHLSLSPKGVLVAGDSGNDIDMFREEFSGIAVGNAKPELRVFVESLAERDHIYQAKAIYAEGVQEGLKHFGIL